MKNIKFGLCVWNIWGDEVVDRPDNIDETITSEMIKWLISNTGIDHVYQFQPLQYPKPKIFQGDYSEQRKDAFNSMVDVHAEKMPYPELDYLFVRWRWDLGLDKDLRLHYQRQTLNHYLKTDTRIFIWDDDFAMSPDERRVFSEYENVTFVEISEEAKSNSNNHVYIPYPLTIDKNVAMSRVLGRSGSNCGDHLDDSMLFAYVGNNYKREEYIEKYLLDSANKFPKRMHMYGNWLKYNHSIKTRYPNIVFHPKVNKPICKWIYQHCHVVPMLAKNVYFTRGHITPRLFEVVMSGGIPIGFNEFKNSQLYFNTSVGSDEEFTEKLLDIVSMTRDQRAALLEKQVDLLIDNKIFSVEEFFKCLMNK
jgi:hypothetical protein